jgi:AbrB family looped-hinge helix DNA binding protein
MTELQKGKYLYATVKVGDRGQIVIPKDARKHFNIKPGDLLVVVGDIKKGLGIATAELMESIYKRHPNGIDEKKGTYDYGNVKVAESYQIVIPKLAREHFDIKEGDKLLVLGDLTKGLAIQKATVMKDLALKILGAIEGNIFKNKHDESEN